MSAPRVTLGVATYSRDTYLAEAVASCLAQDFASLEVLVVVDGSVNPRIDEVLAGFAGDSRLRVVRHPENRGIAEAYNTIVREGRGELIAMLGDDDVCLPDRVSRSVAVFDKHPETAIVHGDAQVIDGDGRGHGVWKSGDLAPGALLQYVWRTHNPLIDPTRMVRREVYEQVGGYHSDFRTSQDFHFFVRAIDAGLRFRHVEGAPLIQLRRHDDNGSGDDQLGRQVEEVEAVLSESLERNALDVLVPELDWAVIDRAAGEKRALEVLAAAVERRGLPLPGLARRLRRRAEAVVVADRVVGHGRKLVMTSFGFNDSGGGTAVPRVLAKELTRRGWDVTVFYAAVDADPSGVPYALSRRVEDGVTLVGVHNRSHAGLLAVGRPELDLDDPPITAAFGDLLDEVRPDVVHFHNLHNLGAELLELPARRGIPSVFSPHNHWLVCPRAYLLRPDGQLCDGPGDGSRCAACIGTGDIAGHVERLDGIRRRFARSVDVCLAMSEAIRSALVDAGYPEAAIDLLPQSMPAVDAIWESVGRSRVPGRSGGPLRVGFFGSVYGLKGPQLLVAAAQKVAADLRVVIHGDVPDAMIRQLKDSDVRGVVEIAGRFTPTELPGLLAAVDVAVAPSLVWETQGLAALEARAARLPVVAARMGGLAEAVRDDVDGLLFDGGDVDGLARALDRLASEDGLIERLQAAIPEPPSFVAFVDALEAVYAGRRPNRERSGPVAVRWRGDHDLPTSLSTINREVCARLDGDASLSIGRAAPASDGTIGAPLPHMADVEVRHEWPPDFTPPASGRLVLIQPWEFGSVPAAWVAPLRDAVDELWVPSEHVRRMYVESGVPGEQVKVIANGVDLDNYSPAGPALALPSDTARPRTRFLFVGGAIARKGIDVLLQAYTSAFAGRDDVELVVKDFGRDGAYRGSDRSALDALAAPGVLPAVTLLTDELTGAEMAGLYRACDVLVHPYRGEGFAMPVLEAMACGLPVVVTAGGPTDEFVPAEAGWSIEATKKPLPADAIAGLPLVADGWMLEPDLDHFRDLLLEVAATDLTARGTAAAAAAHAYSWDAVSASYAQHLHAVAARAPRTHRTPELDPVLTEDGPRILALPAWQSDTDNLPALLCAWSEAASHGTLILVADADRDGTPEQIESRILTAAAEVGADLEHCADIAVRFLHDQPGLDLALLRDADAFIPLHPASAGPLRHAATTGTPVLEPTPAALRAFLATTPALV
jgi:glycosyltransferase involved in cell wall biosynthesis/GT2 family glycosyltransferase